MCNDRKTTTTSAARRSRSRESLAPRARVVLERCALAVIASALLEGGVGQAQSGPDASPPAAGEAATEGAEAQAPEQSALALQGELVFQSACVACHGEDGRGGHGGGVPLDQVRDPALVVATVTDGRGQMPPLGDLLTAEQISAVAAYIVDGLFK